MKRAVPLYAVVLCVLAIAVAFKVRDYLALEGDYIIRTQATEPLQTGNAIVLHLHDRGFGWIRMKHGESRALALRYRDIGDSTIEVHPLITQDSDAWGPWMRHGDCYFVFKREHQTLRLTRVVPFYSGSAIDAKDADRYVQSYSKELFSWMP